MKQFCYILILLIFSCSNDTVNQSQEQACNGPTFVGNVILTTQSDLDDFAAQGYCEIDGNISIGTDVNTNGDDIVSLANLSSINSISGTLSISAFSLTSLQGLENLESAGKISLSYMLDLNSVDPFAQNLTTLNELSIVSCPIESLEPFQNLQSLDRLFLAFAETPSSPLNSLFGLHNIVGELDYLGLGHSNLINLDGLQGITSINELFIYGNSNLSSLLGLENVSEIGMINLSTNVSLESILGFHPSIQSQSITIHDSPLVSDLSPLSNINSLSGSLNLSYLGIESLNDFSDLVSIEGSLNIHGNLDLLTLNGLNNLTNVGEEIIIGTDSIFLQLNEQLTDFCALQNLFTNGTYNPEEVYIENNAYNPTIQDIIDGNCSQ